MKSFTKPPIDIYFFLQISEEHFDKYAHNQQVTDLGAEIDPQDREITIQVTPENVADKISQLLDVVSIHHSEYTRFNFAYLCPSMNNERRNAFVQELENALDDSKIEIDSAQGREAAGIGEDYDSADHEAITVGISTNGQPSIAFYLEAPENFAAYVKIEKDEGPGYEIISDVDTDTEPSCGDLLAAYHLILRISESVMAALQEITKDNQRQ